MEEAISQASVMTGLADRFADVSVKREPVVNVIFVSEDRMRRINSDFLGSRSCTDVIAFDLRQDRNVFLANLDEDDENVVGEIYICPKMATSAARRYQTEPEVEIFLYLVHGMLHLAGYDDAESEDAEKMRCRQTEIVQQLISNFDIVQIIDAR